MIIELVAAGIAIFLLVSVLNTSTPPLNGVYAQPGGWYHVKRALFLVLYWLRQRRQRRRNDPRAFRYPRPPPQGATGAGAGTRGYGERSHEFIPDMDQPQTLADHPDAIDCAYFEGTDADGTSFIMRIGRRHGRSCEVWLSVNIPDLGFYQLPIHPSVMVYNTDGRTFSGGGLRFTCVEAMKKWRVTFNGLLRKGLHNEWSDEKRELVHVKFSFFWDALSDPFDFDTDISALALSDAIAREPWSRDFFHRLRASHQTHYEQCGELRGVVKVEGHDERKLRLKSIRDHSYGVRDWRVFHRYIVHFGYLQDGTFFHVNHICLPETTSYLKCGYVVRPNSEMEKVTWTDLELSRIGENIDPPQDYEFSFTAGGRRYHIKVRTLLTPMYYHTEHWENVIFEKICTFEGDGGVKGYGITEFCYRKPASASVPVGVERSVPLLEEPREEVTQGERTRLVLPFTDPAATRAGLVGGKGCQLAMLTQMTQQSFIVPAGFSLTIAAFHLHLRKNTILKDRVTELEDIACGRAAGDVATVCEAVAAEFGRTEVTEDVRDAIDTELRAMFGEEALGEGKEFAVRSSAAGEDSADLSAAGQMDTILGVRGAKQIHRAVAKCWASHFAHPAVEYRRQHGQPICNSMGVVIQEMVPAQAAGVLFTRDPITGNPGLMVINANYGLGESVVSGLSEPDNICIQRDWTDEVSIVNKDVGSKKKQIITSGGATKTVDVSPEEMEKCSISNDVILRLARIGIELEKAFSDPRDIEWAVEGDTIYLLQARPITALDQETEWELIHEFDSPLSMNTELVTTANIGEMMPGAMTPLTVSVFLSGVDWGLQDMLYQQDLYSQIHKFRKYVCSCANQGLINMVMVAAMWEKASISADVKMGQLALLGETIDDITFADIESYHGSRPLHKRIITGLKNFRNLKNSHGKTKKWGEIVKTMKIGENAKTAQQLYDAIDEELPKYYQCFADTIYKSSASGTWCVLLLVILSKGKHNWTREMYSDVAMLLSKCEDVYSADVPSALQDLASAIATSGRGDTFATMPVQDAVRWLGSRGSCGAACHERYSAFLARHGHRCIREAEFREKSWQSDPAKLIQVLQALVPSVALARKAGNDNAIEDIDEAIATIKSPITKGGRYALKFVLPRARRAVGGREWGKSISIEMVEVFKQAYWRLADMMVSEGRLPDADLMFFFPHHEIGTLLAERSGKLIAKGQRRRKLLSKQMDTKIERLHTGHPVPTEEAETEADYDVPAITLQGLPVSQGVIRGTARVVTSLAHAKLIQPGDILIVHYTDVGWSPYFPLISGLVTEIGGLVSHGAVVAREYGLPCVVNVKKATTLFRSGDQVILNGTLGTLEKLEPSSP